MACFLPKTALIDDICLVQERKRLLESSPKDQQLASALRRKNESLCWWSVLPDSRIVFTFG